MIPDVPSLEVVEPLGPLVPVQRGERGEKGERGEPGLPAVPDSECQDGLSALTLQVESNAATITELLRLAKEHSHEKIEPTPIDLEALADEVIKRLPPFRFQAKTPGPDGKPTGPIIKKTWTKDGSDILYFNHGLETITIPVE